jgi:putative transferase (TIGR04331 family)
MPFSCNRFNSEAEPLELLHYRQMKIDLYRNLTDDIKKNFKYRPYPKQALGCMADEVFIKTNAPEITIVQGELEPQLQKARLVIIDYPGTPLHSIIASNTPIVAIWEKDAWPISKSAEKQFDYLRQAGILHHSIASAASHINQVWFGLDEWWQNPSTVDLRKAWLAPNFSHQ